MSSSAEPDEPPRRELLLRAAIDLLAEGGMKAVTHRGVARRAGVPDPTTGYYFPSLSDLIAEALRLHVDERADASIAHISAALTEAVDATDASTRIAEYFVDSPDRFIVAEFELYLEAARDPALRAPVEAAMRRWIDTAAAVLASLGAREPEPAAERFLALLNGVALHRVTRQRPRDEEVAFLRDTLLAFAVEQHIDRSAVDELRSGMDDRFPM